MHDAADRHQRLRVLFDAALRRAPATRAGYLDAVCSDDGDLRGEVARLLVAHDRAHTFLEHPAAEMEVWPAPAVFTGNARFTVIRTLGIGGMGIVYEVRDTERDEVVALKTVLHGGAANIYRLKQEFRTLADVAHVNLVCLYELFVEETHGFFTMELVRGTSFIDYVRADPSPAGREARLVPAFAQLVAGVTALHRAGKLHRDIKPSNVLVTPAGRVVILDFGVMTELRPSMLVAAEAGVGTPAYMSPEEATGGRASEASDWYAVGATVYEALTGDVPIAGAPLAVLQRKPHHDPPRPRDLVPDTSAALDAICMGLLHRDPRQRLTGRDALAMLPGSGSGSGSDSDSDSIEIDDRADAVAPGEPPFVGRTGELAVLQQQFARAADGEAPAVIVSGPSGIGKSALLRAFVKSCGTTALVLPGRCYESESVPYKALDGVIDSLSHHLRRLPRDAVDAVIPRDIAALTRLFPVLRQSPAIAAAHDADRDEPPAPTAASTAAVTAASAVSASAPAAGAGLAPAQAAASVDPIALRQRALTALRELLACLAAKQPLVIWIDDLQWSDDDSAVVLADLLRPPGPRGLLTVLCARGEGAGLPPLLRTLRERADSGTVSIDLGPIAAADASALVQAVASLDSDAASAIVDEAAGNPFLLEQLARHRQARGTSSKPPRFADVLDRQLRTLPAEARRFLETLAVCSRPMTPAIIARAAVIAGDLRPLLALLRTAHVIRSSDAPNQIETYHDRIRETIANTLAPDATRWIHVRMAETLTLAGIDDPEALYEHCLGAGDPEPASVHAAAAAIRASDALAFDRAALYYTRALQLAAPPAESDAPRSAGATPSSPAALGTSGAAASNSQAEGRAAPRADAAAARHSWQVGLATALANAGRPARAADAFLDAVAQADPAERVELQRRAAEQLLIGGHIDRGLVVIDRVLEDVGMRLARGPRRALASLIWRRLRLRWRGLDFTTRAADDIDPATLLRVDTCWSVMTGLATVDMVRANDFCTRHLLLALAAGEPYRVARGLAVQVAFSSMTGGPQTRRAQAMVTHAQALAARVDRPHTTALTLLTAGLSALALGRWREASTRCGQALPILRDRCAGVTWELNTAHNFLLGALLYQGELADVSARVPPLLADAQARGNLYVETELCTRMNLVWLAADQPDDGERLAIASIQRWSQRGFHRQHYSAALARIQTELYRGDAAAAWTLCEECRPALRQTLLMRAQLVRVEYAFLRGRCAIAMATSAAAASRRAEHPRDPAAQPRVRQTEAAAFLAIARAEAGRIARERMDWATPIASLLLACVAACEGATALAISELDTAIAGFDRAGMQLYAFAARTRLAALAGDERGTQAREEAARFVAAQRVRNPEAMARMLAP